ncbi:hypothetical protein DXG01_011292 [Tephrocybe rancida]|nr:hypothetical protein DXG01_011292 [Tephrocybe rancida]
MGSSATLASGSGRQKRQNASSPPSPRRAHLEEVPEEEGEQVDYGMEDDDNPPSDPGDYAFDHEGDNDPTQSAPNLIIHPATPCASGLQSATHRPAPTDQGASSPMHRHDDDNNDKACERPRPEKKTVNADPTDPSAFTAEQINIACQFVHQTIGQQSPLASSTQCAANSPPTVVRTPKRSKGKGCADPLPRAAQHAPLSTHFAYNPLPPSEQNGHSAHAGPSMQPQQPRPFQPTVTESIFPFTSQQATSGPRNISGWPNMGRPTTAPAYTFGQYFTVPHLFQSESI